VAPINTYVTSQNVVIASNPSGTPVPIAGLPPGLANIGVFTGVSGSNSIQVSHSFTSIGGDTQLLGNFEYRIPLISDKVSAALFTDIGSSFNLRSNDNQFFNSNFLPDQPYLSSVGFISCARSPAGAALLSLTTLAACNGPQQQLALTGTNGLVMQGPRFVTSDQLANAINLGPVDPFTGLPFGYRQVFLRGDAQTNTAVLVPQSLFAKIGDYRTSMGMEIRVQVPVINVPFRLIFAYNPNARPNQIIDGFPFTFNEKKFVTRFSVGRTF
jgi:outer membrane protein insertion porin family